MMRRGRGAGGGSGPTRRGHFHVLAVRMRIGTVAVISARDVALMIEDGVQIE